jgi:hypothetical protein
VLVDLGQVMAWRMIVDARVSVTVLDWYQHGQFHLIDYGVCSVFDMLVVVHHPLLVVVSIDHMIYHHDQSFDVMYTIHC